MLATFVIGLREGLEAALIVGIIAAFLRNNGKSLTAMWLGVGLALVLSVLVGVGLDLVEKALPQAEQEGMETVIGAVAIFFVTGMIAWMNTHARSMKRELEAQAAAALSEASTWALALMAFLAVLKEGFETAVFLLATFSAAQSAALAATGAVLGILLAVVIGWGIYIGGVRINLGRFFRVTGAFLILVAAGLVITALRTAHEAGWLNAGQQQTVDLAWLVAPGTVQSALITGVLGIPADPRLIEVLGWFAYLVPVVLYVYWPSAQRPTKRGTARVQAAIGLLLLILAGGLALLYPMPRPHAPEEATVFATDGATPLGTVRLVAGASGAPQALALALQGGDRRSLPLASGATTVEDHNGIAARSWHFDSSTVPPGLPKTLTLDQVVTLNGGRIPVGLNPAIHPGPYDAAWSRHRGTAVWLASGLLLDASEETDSVVTLSGSGLGSPRTLAPRAGLGGPGDAALTGGWQVSDAYGQQVSAALGAYGAARSERLFWAAQLPVLLAIGAAILWLLAWRNGARHRRSGPGAPHADRPRAAPRVTPSQAGGSAGRSPRGASHVAD